MNRGDKFLFYQLNPFKRLKEEKLKDKGIKEKHIENLFCQNLENTFSGWISLSQQRYLEHPEKDEENCIVDSLAFNFYEENFLSIDCEKLPDWLSIEKKQKDTVKNSSNGGEKNELDYSQSIEEITKLEWMSSNVKKWLTEIDNYLSLFFLSQSKPLIKKVNAKKENYYPVINYKSEGKIVISVVIKVSQINVYWNFKEKTPGNRQLTLSFN